MGRCVNLGSCLPCVSSWCEAFRHDYLDAAQVRVCVVAARGCCRGGYRCPGNESGATGYGRSLEARKRIEELLEGVREAAVAPENLRNLRAVETLEHIGTPEAREVLKLLANGAAAARLTREAKAALERLARRAP
jgi:hypothetical protein